MSVFELLQQVQAAYRVSGWVQLCAVLATFYTPEESGRYLWDTFRMKRNSRRLAQLRAAGTGPKYFRDGNVVRYREDHLREWAENSLGQAFVSTSEESASREAPWSPNHDQPTQV
jgi:hypothetical protein